MLGEVKFLAAIAALYVAMSVRRSVSTSVHVTIMFSCMLFSTMHVFCILCTMMHTDIVYVIAVILVKK